MKLEREWNEDGNLIKSIERKGMFVFVIDRNQFYVLIYEPTAASDEHITLKFNDKRVARETFDMLVKHVKGIQIAGKSIGIEE